MCGGAWLDAAVDGGVSNKYWNALGSYAGGRCCPVGAGGVTVIFGRVDPWSPGMLEGCGRAAGAGVALEYQRWRGIGGCIDDIGTK